MMTSMPLPAFGTTLAAPLPLSLGETTLTALAQAALFQARRNLGNTRPNPSVGAVIADPDTGEIIASAVTAPGGRPHAEVLALREAGERARGALLFTTLEPCSHFGATPPCADAIAGAGIATVIYGSLDPDPRVSGRGIAKLRTQGIAVMRGPLAEEADWLNLGHTLRVTVKRPFVQIKLAVDADGNVAVGNGKPVWVTGEEARAQAHLLRARADAILVGRNTVERDNPLLTCRLPGLEDCSPVRVVLSTKPQLPADAALLNGSGPPVWIIRDGETAGSNDAQPQNVRVMTLPRGADGGLDLGLVLKALADEGIARLLVEGGPATARAFLDAGFADEVIIMQGAHRAAGPTMLPFAGEGIDRLISSPHFVRLESRRAGADTISIFRSRNHWNG